MKTWNILSIEIYTNVSIVKLLTFLLVERIVIKIKNPIDIDQ